MKDRNAKRKWFFLLVVVILVTITVISGGVFSAKKQEPKTRQHPKEWLRTAPPVLSEIKDLEIINQRIIRPNTDAPGVAFEIRNNSSRGVMAVEISCGQGAIATDGLEDDENPKVIIEPYGTLSAEMNDELTPGEPMVITAAVFEDGTEEGQQSSLDLMHKIRLRQRALLKERKGKLAPGRSPEQ